MPLRLALGADHAGLNLKATVADLYYASLHSGSDNIQATLHYLDYQRSRDTQRARKTETVASLLSAHDNLRKLVTRARRSKVAKPAKSARKPGRSKDGDAPT